MEKDQKLSRLEDIVRRIRYATLAVQVIPVIYTAAYLLSLSAYWVIGGDLLYFTDAVTHVSLIVVAAFLVLSKILRLCRWHGIACVLPLIPQCVSFIDYYVLGLSEVAAQINILVFASTTALLLLAIYNIFIK